MNIAALAIGGLSACVVVWLFKAWELENTKWAYPVLLAEFPVNYWIFAIYGADPRALIREILVGIIFLGVACIGYRARLRAASLALAVGFVAHAAYDFSHDEFFVNAGTPAWWPEYCGAVDVLIGAYVGYLALSGVKEPQIE